MVLKHPFFKTGYLGPFNILKVPVYLHWSFFFAGLFLASAVGQKNLLSIIILIFSYTFLVLLHEFGHAYAARQAGANVPRIEIKGSGGFCYYEGNLSYHEQLLVSSAGLIVQIIVFVLTCLLTVLFGEPNNNAFSSFVFVFIYINGLAFLVNAIPYGKNDGKQIYTLIRNRKYET